MSYGRPPAGAYHIRLTETPERTAGGIILIDDLREQFQDGIVEARGPGEHFDGVRAPMYAEVGDRVLFLKHNLRMIDDRARVGLVRDADLLALVDADGDLTPLNDFVLIEIESREAVTEGGVLLPEQIQQRPNRGRIRRVGPGRVRRKRLTGTRSPCGWEAGVEDAELVGAPVWWSDEAEVLSVGTGTVDRFLLRFDGAVVVEVPNG